MGRIIGKLGLLLFLLFITSSLFSQRITLKSNAFQWATLRPNIGLELLVSKRITLDISASALPRIAFSPGFSTAFFSIEPKVRYWFSRPLAQHSLGGMVLLASNDFTVGSQRYYGDNIGMGAFYGYSWVLDKRWNLEVTAGLGVAYYRQRIGEKSTAISETPKEGFMLIPMNLGVTFSYILF